MVLPGVIEFFMEEVCILLEYFFDVAEIGDSGGEETFSGDAD
jgi:hypothetical protein